MMNFDPDERSRLRSGASNIRIDTDERLYAFDEPITVSDFRARSRTLSIGDHHFYDHGIPYAQVLGSRRRAILGFLAGRAYVNRTRPHDGDMMRAISATQFGMFIDDMPVYDTTTETDRAMLRALVSGRIVDLPRSSRERIERALINATHIHSAITAEPENKHELYRVVNADPVSFIEGLVVGERIPMPITAFSRTRPRTDAGETVIRIQRGAKAIDANDGQFITQGTFEVVALDEVDGQVIATLKHVETYDPRHHAMRPVDRFSDRPGAMRRLGTPRPRYTQQEQQRMEVDLARRRDKAEIDERMYGLRSSGSGLGDDVDREIDLLIEGNQFRSPGALVVIKQLRARITQELQARVNKRLDQAREMIADLHQGRKPWRDDADTMRKFVSSDPVRRQEVLAQTFSRAKQALLSSLDENGDSNVKWVAPGADKGLVAHNFFVYTHKLELRDLDDILNNGVINVYGTTRSGNANQLTAQVPISLTDEEREVFQNIRDMLAVGIRAYLLEDKSGTVIKRRSGGDLIVAPQGPFANSGAAFVFRGEPPRRRGDRPTLNTYDGEYSAGGGQAFQFDGHVRRIDEAGVGRMAGSYHRTVSVRDGKIVIEHGNMNMEGAGGGAATFFNQHAWQWWKQIPGTTAVLTAATDGPIVWPRHGFHPTLAHKHYNEENGVDFGILINAISYVIAATSNDQATRKKARDMRDATTFGENLVQVRLDKDGKRLIARNIGQSIINKLRGEKQEDMPEAELSPSDKRLRERLGLWLALAIEDKQRGRGEPRRATVVMLANLLDASDMTDSQLMGWRSLFSEIFWGEYKIELDGTDDDADWLPSFIISDDDPTASQVMRQVAISEERRRNSNNDMFVPSAERDKQSSPNIDDQKGRVSRLQSLWANSRAQEGADPRNVPTSETVLAREISGNDELPRLINRTDAVELFESTRQNPPTGNRAIRPWKSRKDSKRDKKPRVALVGVIQDSRKRFDVPLLIETAGRYLRRSRSTQWDEIDKRFTMDAIFTSTPGEFVERFVDINDPTADPVDNKIGLLGITDENARWTTRDDLGALTRTVYDAIQKIHADHGTSPMLINTGMDRISMLAIAEVNGRRLYNRWWTNVGYQSILDTDVLDEFLDEHFPDADKEAMRSIFGSFGDHITMLETSSEGDKEKIRRQTNWLYFLLTDDASIGDDSRRRQTLASILGYDFLDETPSGSTRSTVHVLNRGALTMVDEPVSLSEINELTGATTTPRTPRALRSSGIATTMMLGDDGAPTLLRLDDPLGVTPTEMRSLSYSRSLRQDFGISAPRSLRSSGGNRDYDEVVKREREWFRSRNDRRQAVGNITSSATPAAYAVDVKTRMEEHSALTEAIEKIDNELIELDQRLTDLVDSGELTPTLDKEIDDQYWSLEARKAELEMQAKDIADSVASDINTLNEMMDVHEQREGLMFAIRKFLSEQVSLDIPEAYREKLQALLTDLEAQAARAPSTKDLRAMHKTLSRLLDDDNEFDVRWDITRDVSNAWGEDVEGVDLEDFDDDYEWAGEKWLEWIYRSFFDPSYETWKDTRISRAFDKQTEIFDNLWRIMGTNPPKRKQSIRRMLEDMVDNVATGITADERRLWGRQHDDVLREEYNADYEETLIDATPADSSAVPNNVPERVWKKIVASVRLARRTPYDGEREAALDAAKRMIEPHRPDLADDDYLMSLRSAGRGASYPMISGVNLNRMGLSSRGASPETITTPKPDRFDSRLIERLAKYGVTQEDFAVDGKYGKVLFALLSPSDPLSIADIERIIDNSNLSLEIGNGERASLDEILGTPLSAEDKIVLKEIIRESAKLAAQSGWGIQPIEGHRVKKINGPNHEELADVLVDEVDLSMIRAMGAPTYGRITKIHAAWARAMNKLNKMFGAYESRDDNGTVTRVGSELESPDGSAYKSFIEYGDPKIDGDMVRYHDARGNVVMSVSREIATEDYFEWGGESRISPPGTIVLNIGSKGVMTQERGTANDAILQAMFEATGVTDYSIARLTNPEDRSAYNLSEETFTSSSGRSLTFLRERLALARKRAEMMEFAPTPAGRHMENLVVQEIRRLESHIDMYERMGQRLVRLMQESEGLSKEEVGERLKTLANLTTRTTQVYTNGSPASETSTLSMFELALSAFLSMRLGSKNLPRITDQDDLENGTHEIGHFVFGQAFTRHGEFMANFWPYAALGPEFWRTFATNQQFQSDIFDRMTIYEEFGLHWTREQREAFDSLSDVTKAILQDAGVVVINAREKRGRTQLRRSHVDRFRNDTIRNIQEDPSIDEIEKAEIITGLQRMWGIQDEKGAGARRYRRINDFRDEFALDKPRNESKLQRIRERIDVDLTPEIMQILGINLDEEDPHMDMRVNTPWDIFVPIEPSDIGWQRTQAPQSGLRSGGRVNNPRGRFSGGEFDETILQLIADGLSVREMVDRLGTTDTTVRAVIKRLDKEGRITEFPGRGRKKGKRDAIIQLFREGRTMDEIAEQLGLSRYYVRNEIGEARKSGVLTDKPARKLRAFRADDDAIVRFVEEGLTIKQIAERLGMKPQDVYMRASRLRREGRIGEIAKEEMSLMQRVGGDLGLIRQATRPIRLRAYRNYTNNISNGMSRNDAAAALLTELEGEDIRVQAERGTRHTRTLNELLKLLDVLHAGIPDEEKSHKGPQLDENLYIVINEMKLFGFSARDTADILKISPMTVNKYRQIHFRAYRQDSQTPKSVRSGGARPNGTQLLFSGRQESLRSSGARMGSSGVIDNPTVTPSTGKTQITDNIRTQLGRVRTQAKKAEQTRLEVTHKNESDFTSEEHRELEQDLDAKYAELDEMNEELTNEIDELYLEQGRILTGRRLTKTESQRVDEIHDRLEEIEEEKAVIDRGYEAVRLGQQMIRNLLRNRNQPRGDQFSNQYIIVRDERGDLVGMTMWGRVDNEFDFLLAGVGTNHSNVETFPPDQRARGRSLFVDFLVSFQTVEGMGSYLFSKILRDSKGKNVKLIVLETTTDSNPYWERMGFATRPLSSYHELIGNVDEMVDELDKVDTEEPKSLRSSGSTTTPQDRLARATAASPHIHDKPERKFKPDYEKLEALDPTGDDLDILPVYDDPLDTPLPQEVAEQIEVTVPTRTLWDGTKTDYVTRTAIDMSSLDVESSMRADSEFDGIPAENNYIGYDFRRRAYVLYERLQRFFEPFFTRIESTDHRKLYALDDYTRNKYRAVNMLLRRGNIPEDQLETVGHKKVARWIPGAEGELSTMEMFQPMTVERVESEAREIIEGLDSLFAEVPKIIEPIQTFRGIYNWKVMQAIEEAGVGGIIEEKGFMSTSMSILPLMTQWFDYGGAEPFDPRWKKWHPFSASWSEKEVNWTGASKVVTKTSKRAMPLMRIIVPEGSRVLVAGVLHRDEKGHGYFKNAQTQSEAEVLLPRNSRFRILSITDSYVTVELIVD